MLIFFVSLGEKEQLAQSLKNEEDARKSYAGEVSRLKAKMEKLKGDHAAQITHVTEATSIEIANAREEFDATEKKLRVEINTLKQENRNLQAHSDGVAKKMLDWHDLARKANEKMDG